MSRTRIPHGNEDVNFFRCKRCNFPCNLSRDKTGTGSGLRYDDVTYTGDNVGPSDPVAISGCPYCGTKNYKNWQK